MHHISRRAGEDDITRRNDFKALSDGQKDIISQVLGRLQIVSTDVQIEIRASQTVVTTHLAAQDASAQQSESRVMRRFDALDVVTKDAARANHGLTSHLQYQGKVSLKHRLLDALAFPEMTDRRNMIEGRVDDFGETYQWMFSLQGGRDSWKGCHGFVEWLRTGTGIFWINGKPGSGKSTPMDFIYQNLQPNGLGFAHLEEWAAPRPVRLLNFWFFRPATSVLLKSLQGFWRSLCFQILDNDRTLVDNIQQDARDSVPEALKSCLQVPGSHSQSWTDAELKSWFTYLITHSEYHYCLLIDGLDEVTGNRQALLDTVQEIAQNSEKIKICCSSRPEAPFAQVLRKYPSLRLQDFNFDDIEEYCRMRLDGTRAVVYADTIASRAEGVFLWAYLVTEDLRTAVNQGDTEEDLILRLGECPGGMNELFTFLLERQDKFYAKHPKPYLRLLDVATKNDPGVTVLELFIASENQDIVRSRFPVKPDDNDDEYLAALNNSAVNFEANLVDRCAGLVECKQKRFRCPKYDDAYPYENLARLQDMEVNFIHRSVQDFLAEGEEGIALLRSYSISEQDAWKRLMTASALIFLVIDDMGIGRPLNYAGYIDKESWTPFETSVADDLFSALHLREPSWDTFDRVVRCPQLSPTENKESAAALGPTAYLAAKLTVYDPAKSSVLAAISMCQHLSKTLVDPDRSYADHAELTRVLQPYLRHTQTLTLHYDFERTGTRESYYAATCHLWQHLYLALTTAFFRFDPRRRKYHEAYSICEFILSSSTGEELGLDCRIVLTPYGRRARIAPAPDDDNDDDDAPVSSKTYTRGYRTFKIRMSVQGIEEWSGSSVDFLQYSPPGLDRFFDIEPSINESLRMALDRLPVQKALVRGDTATTRCIPTILNSHLDDLSPAEVAEVVCFRNEALCSIFSKGHFHGTSRRERKEWEKRLKAGNFVDDFETNPEHDPILREILKRLQLNAATEAEREGEWQAEWEAEREAEGEAERAVMFAALSDR
jgi:hypothetical protein